VQEITKSFGGLRAVHRVSCAVGEGETIGMIGPNGAGKSTFFNLISGFLRPDDGGIRFRGKEIQGKRPDEICRLGITRTFQLIQNFPKMTVLENVMVGAFARTEDPAQARENSMEMLEVVHLSKKASLPVKSLTYAEKKSVELARALATEPKLILVDEYMAGLTPTEIQEAIGLFRRIREERRLTLFLVEHIMQAIMALSDRVIVLHHGEKIAESKPQEIVRNPAVMESYLGEEDLLA
jgi:branched-chain amino acid transport system ATP-binding protein